MKSFIYAAAWLGPLIGLYSCQVIQSEPISSYIRIFDWLAVLVVTAVVILRWDRQFSRPKLQAWITLVLAASLAIASWSLGNVLLLSLAISVYCFAWASTHFERRRNNSEEAASPTLLSYLPALIAAFAIPQAVMQQINDWQWYGLTSYAWTVVQHCEIPFLISSSAVEFPIALWTREAIFGGLFSVKTPIIISMLWLGWMNRPVLLSPLHATAVVTAAFLSNFVRFCAAAWCLSNLSVDCYDGWPFYVLGSLALICTLFVFLAADRIIWVLLFPIVPADKTEREDNPLTYIWNHYFSVLSNKLNGRPQA